MTMSPDEIRQKMFNTTRLKEGYVADEVDEFLDAVADDLESCQRNVQQLSTQLRNIHQTPPQVYQEQQPVPGVEDTASLLSAESIKSILVAAQQAADRIEADAAAQAALVQSEAERKARILASEARQEAEQIVGAASAGADERIAQLRTEQTQLENAVKRLQTREADYRKFLKSALDSFNEGLKQEF